MSLNFNELSEIDKQKVRDRIRVKRNYSFADEIIHDIKDIGIVGSTIDWIAREVDNANDEVDDEFIANRDSAMKQFFIDNPSMQHNEIFLENYKKTLEETTNPIDFKKTMDALRDNAIGSTYWRNEHPFASKVSGLMAGLSDVPLLLAMTASAEVTLPALAVASTSTMTRKVAVGAVAGIVQTAILDATSTREVGSFEYAMSGLLGGTINHFFGNRNLLNSTSEKVFNKIMDTDGILEKAKKMKPEEAEAFIKKETLSKVDELKRTFNDTQLVDLSNKKDLIDGSFLSKGDVTLDSMVKKSQSETLSSLGKQLFHDRGLQYNGFDNVFGDEVSEMTKSAIENHINLGLARVENVLYDKASGWTKKVFSTKNRTVISEIMGEVQKRRANSTFEEFSDGQALGMLEKQLMDRIDGIDVKRAKATSYEMLKTLKDIANKTYDTVKENGGKYLDKVEKSDRYMPTIYNYNLREDVMKVAGKDGELSTEKEARIFFEKLVYEAIRDENEGLTEKELGKIAKEFADNFFGQNLDPSDVFQGRLGDYFLAKGSSITKQKIKMNRLMSVEIDGKTVSLIDFVSNDYLGSMSAYARKAGGTIAREKTKIPIVGKVSEIKDMVGNILKLKSLKTRLTHEEAGVRKGALTELKKLHFKDAGELVNELDKQINGLKAILGTDRANSAISTIGTLNAFKFKVGEKELSISGAKRRVEDIAEQLKKLHNHKRIKVKVDGKFVDSTESQAKKEDLDKIAKLEKEQKDIERALHNVTMSDEIFDMNRELNRILTEPLNLAEEGVAEIARNRIKKELGIFGKASDTHPDVVRFDTLMKHYQGKALMEETGYTKFGRIISNLVSATKLGKVAFSMAAEMGRVVYHSEMENTIKHLGLVGEVFNTAKTGKAKSKMIEELQMFGVGTDLNTMQGQRYYDADFNPILNQSKPSGFKGLVDWADNTSEKMAQSIYHLSGMKTLNASMETLLTQDTLTKFMQLAKNRGSLSEGELILQKELGLSDQMLEKISNEIQKHSEIKDGMIVALNSKNWDKDVLLQTRISSKRYTNTMIQKGGFGATLGIAYQDKLVAHTVFGKMILALQHYAISAYRGQLGRAINRRDRRILTEIGVVTAFTAFGQAAKIYLDNIGDDVSMRHEFTVENIAMKTLIMVPELSYSSSIFNMASSFLGKDIGGNDISYRTSPIPTISLLTDIGYGIGDAIVDTADGDFPKAFADFTKPFVPNVIGQTQFEKAVGTRKTGSQRSY